MKTKPYKHQLEEFNAHVNDRSRALFWEMGTGKTKVALDTTAYHGANGSIDAAVVVAPSGVERNWLTDEIPTHLDFDVQPFLWRSNRSGTKWFQRQMAEVLNAKFPFVALSYEAWGTDSAKEFIWDLVRKRKTLLHVDESQRIKSPRAGITKSVVKASQYFAMSRLYSGTPIDNSPFDIYSQIRVADPTFWIRELGIKEFADFKAFFGIWDRGFNKNIKIRYNRDGEALNDQSYGILVGFQNLGILREKLNRISSRVLLDDVTDLPPASYSKTYYDLTSTQRTLYDQLEEEYATSWPDDPEQWLTAELSIVRMLRLQQILCGYVPFDDDDPREPRLLVRPSDNPRLAALGSFIERVEGQQTCIWAIYRKDIDLIVERLREMGRKPVRYDGAVGEEERARHKAAFASGDASDFVANPSVGAEGLTLVNSHICAVYNNNYRMSKRKQLEARIRRIGQTLAQLYMDFVCPGTRDEVAISILQRKHRNAATVLGDKETIWLTTN